MAAAGVVVVDKPAGPTSHDVVNRLRRLYATKRVGHAGTLDPPATGILLVGLERATRALQFLQRLPKTYEAGVVFGTTTTTEDATGSVLETRPCAFGRAELEAGILRLVGEIQQVPPMVSAVRVGGERLYVAARRGEQVERPARPVTVYEFSVLSFDGEAWEATVRVRCSSGTYVRTLAADLGQSLGCGAHLRWLRRVSIGSLGESEAVALRKLEEDPGVRSAAVLPLATALRDLDALAVDGDPLSAVSHGRSLPDPVANRAEGTPVVVLDPGGEVVAIYERSAGELRPSAVLVAG